MRGYVIGTVAVALAVTASSALAGSRTGYQAIAAGDLRQAEATLVAERRIFPDRPELMLNLAAVYGQTGRADAARTLYRNVLDRPSVSMLMPSGVAVSSHDVAMRGLSRLGAPELATR